MADDIFIQSRELALNKFGQNGFQGPASDLPGTKTTSGFLPETKLPEDSAQTRKVDASPIATHPGMASAPKHHLPLMRQMRKKL
jgi:hypothetical protein